MCCGGKSFHEVTLKQIVVDVTIIFLHYGDDFDTVCCGGDYGGLMWGGLKWLGFVANIATCSGGDCKTVFGGLQSFVVEVTTVVSCADDYSSLLWR